MAQDDIVRTRFDRYDDASQPEHVVPGYRSTATRTPAAAALEAQPGVGELTGPLFADEELPSDILDLATDPATGRRAIGQLIEVTGRLLDEEGRPVRHSLIEIWQANAAGRYVHAHDDNVAPLDPDFSGIGRLFTDAEGRYAFRTIKPGAYAVPGPENWWRPPHIHLSLFGSSWMSRLVTQMYFPGEPLNAADGILNAIPDAAARERLICRTAANPREPAPALGFAFDIVLRGKAETPFLAS